MSNYLTGGQSLAVEVPLVSANGAYQLVMQTDSNLVLYRNAGYKALWASNTVGKGGVVATFQTDGNLVIYTADGEAVWASNTYDKGGMILLMQDDGNLVIYPTALWSTGTEQG